MMELMSSVGWESSRRIIRLVFKGRYNLEGAQVWHQEIEKIFIVMVCIDAYKVLFETYMLSAKAEY